MIKIITGSTGSNHITSDDDRQFNNAIYGDSYVLPLGEKFKATLVDNNTITISDGDLVLQGCHARINAGTTEDVTIETGAIGVNRIDLIVARYELDSVTGYEDVNLVVIKGEESVNPVAPAYNTGSLRNGANVVDMPLYKVSITGISIEEVQQLFTVSEFIAKSVERLNSNLTDLQTLNFSQTSIPSGTSFNNVVQQLMNKMFPLTKTLYDNGTSLENFGISGYTIADSSQPITNATYGANYATVNGAVCIMGTINTIDCTNFSRLHIAVRNTYDNTKVSVLPTKDIYYIATNTRNDATGLVQVIPASSTYTELTYNISNITSRDLYISLYGISSNSALTVYKIWLD